MNTSLLRLAAALLVVGPLHAQSVDPKRPALPANADTNSAYEYYRLGLRELESNPLLADRAFSWASMLAPDWAEPLLARRIALIIENDRRLEAYLGRASYLQKDRTVRLADSLHLEGLKRNPLVHQGLSQRLVEVYFERATGLTAAFIDWNKQDPALVGWLEYARGQYEASVQAYARALKRQAKRWDLHGDRARSFFHLAQTDSAVAELHRMLAGQREADAKELVRLYDSKAMTEYTIGLVELYAGRLGPAREAFQRALTEDLSFAMAHVQLAELAAEAKDMETMAMEYGQAAELAPHDAAIRYRFGLRLMEAQRWADALPHFQRATELAPWFALPWLRVGIIQQSAGEDDAARTALRTFMARAPRHAERERTLAGALLRELDAAQ